MEQLIAELKAVPLAEGDDEMFYPGEIEARNEARNRRDGLLLPGGHAGGPRQGRSRDGRNTSWG